MPAAIQHSPAFVAEVIERYGRGETERDIAREMASDRQRVRRVLQLNGIAPRQRSERPMVPRFWKNVAKAGPRSCWLWTGSIDEEGYGRLVVAGKSLLAHRIAFYLANGHWPRVGRHTCDHPWCVNALHILDGTQSENIADRNARGRTARGERCGSAKLTVNDVRQIRAMRGSMSYVEIARVFGVGKTLIGNIMIGRKWGWLK